MYEWSREGIRTGTESGEPERAYRRITVDGVDYQYNTDLITILLLGIDARDGGMSGQSDAITELPACPPCLIFRTLLVKLLSGFRMTVWNLRMMI